MTGPDIEIIPVRNGFLIRPGYDMSRREPSLAVSTDEMHVFNTLDDLFNWMRTQYAQDVEKQNG